MNDPLPPSLISTLRPAIANRLHVLCCPACKGSLNGSSEGLQCGDCGASYPIKNGKIYFDEPPKHETAEAGLKEWLKRKLHSHYAKAVRLIAPVYPFSPQKFIAHYIDPQNKIVVDLGCGSERIHPEIIAVDLFDYDSVDIVCRLENLPFRNNSVDAFTSFAVLEHVEDAFNITNSIQTMTRPEGLGIHLVPFLYHFHESPRDYIRFTHMGLPSLFKKWKVITITNTAGAASFFLLHLIEFLSIVFSFGARQAKEAIYLCLTGLLFPIKFLDFFFVNNPRYFSLAPTFCIVVQKPNTKPPEVATPL